MPTSRHTLTTKTWNLLDVKLHTSASADRISTAACPMRSVGSSASSTATTTAVTPGPTSPATTRTPSAPSTRPSRQSSRSLTYSTPSRVTRAKRGPRIPSLRVSSVPSVAVGSAAKAQSCGERIPSMHTELWDAIYEMRRQINALRDDLEALNRFHPDNRDDRH